jgi:hypothetical protein
MLTLRPARSETLQGAAIIEEEAKWSAHSCSFGGTVVRPTVARRTRSVRGSIYASPFVAAPISGSPISVASSPFAGFS